jgi:hypothetical protein
MTETRKHQVLKEAAWLLMFMEYNYVRYEHRCYYDYSRYMVADIYASDGVNRYVVECEANPNPQGLRAKADQIHGLGESYHGVLVIEEEDYSLPKVKGLEGLFHRVLVYSLEEERFTHDHLLEFPEPDPWTWLREMHSYYYYRFIHFEKYGLYKE